MAIQPINSILLTGTENSVALPVIRSLNAIMPDVHIHSISRENGWHQIPRYSRYLSSHQYIRSTSEEGLMEELTDKIMETGADILLPVDEYFVRMFSVFKDELEKIICLPPLPKPGMFDSLVYKNKLNDLLLKFGFPSAITWRLDRVDTDEIGDDIFPCLVKPVFGSSGRGIAKIADRMMLDRFMLRRNHSEYILQEFIPGADFGCSILAVDGEIKALTVQKSLAKTGFSFSTAMRFEPNHSVERLVGELIKKTGYSGLANLDFRLDERDGKPKLTDFNARFWQSIFGAKAAGVDFVMLSCYAALGIPFDRPDFRESTYLMGRSSLAHYRRKWFGSSPYQHLSTTTDVRQRISDPLPEIIRLL